MFTTLYRRTYGVKKSSHIHVHGQSVCLNSFEQAGRALDDLVLSRKEITQEIEIQYYFAVII